MTNRSFITLVVLAAVSVAAAAVAVGRAPSYARTDVTGTLVFPDLRSRINDVYGMIIEQHGLTLTFKRNDEGWRLEESGGYPARAEEISKTILGLSELALLEPKTGNRDRLKKLQLNDPAEEGSLAQRVTLVDKDGKQLAKVVVGKANHSLPETATGGIYVRLTGDKRAGDRAWLAKGLVDLDSETRDWLVRRIINIASERLRHVTVDGNGDTPIMISKKDPKGEQFALAEVPDGKQARLSDLRSLAGTLFGLLLNDVKPRGSIDLTDAKAVRARFETFNGLLADIVVSEKDGKSWVVIDASTTADAKPEAVEEAAKINKSVKAWVYEIPDYNGDIVRKSKADLLEDKKKPAS